MANDAKTRPLDVLLKDFKRLSAGAWIAIVALVVLLVLAIVGVYYSGTDDLAAGVSGPGLMAMTFGVLFTIAVGAGLMGLIFYSSRRGYDDPPAVDPTDKDREP
jgi:formate hydrogenlyase subunit 3/multisubunit Na+/H+ antiporter MnhD subunit